MNVLVTGIGGYIGTLIARALLGRGHDVRGFSRRPDRIDLDVPVIGGDAVTGDGLELALEGVDVAYFLIHSMEPVVNGTGGTFSDRELRSADKKDFFVDYCSQGKKAYYIASTIKTDRTEDTPDCVLQQLSDRFEMCAFGLGEVRREWERRDDGEMRILLTE